MSAIVKVSKSLQDISHRLEAHIEQVAGEKCGFVLLIFTDDVAQYVSNCDRKVSIDQLRKLLSYWEKGMPDVRAHHVN